MNKDRFTEILKKFLSENRRFPLYLLGTGNLMMQGINLKPNDIDFITSKAAILKLAKKYKVSVFENKSGYFETKIIIDKTKIHLVSNDGNQLRPNSLKQNSVKVIVDELNLRGLTLESERETYRRMGRVKDRNKVNLIENQIRINEANK